MQLPIVIQKEVNTYLYDALPLCIILAHPGIQDWFFSHYLNVCSTVHKHDGTYKGVFIRYMEGGIYFEPRKDHEVLEYNPMSAEFIIHSIDLVNFLKVSLESGFYVIAFFDEYFLGCKSAYNINHFVHESLIYGYDDSEGGFYAVSFDSGKNFTSIFIPYTRAVDGIKMACTQTSTGMFQAYLHILKPIPSRVIFDYPNFKWQIKNYLNSTMDLVDTYHQLLYDHTEGDTTVNFKYGIGVYDELEAAYKNVDLSWALSWETYMNFHLLAEQKRHVLKSLCYVNTNVLENPVLSTLLESYGHIVNKQELLRMRHLKLLSKLSKYPPADPPSFDGTIATLQEIRDREFAILTQIMALLP
ncbi:MAG: hypothetical protein LBP20_05870 [Treponema sp.]|jgi:hypothetical protein|nr:hypothetical protein [Treponema sp.]